MKAKQLEIFKDSDFETKHTYIKHYDNWYLFDNVKNRTDFTVRTDNRYMAVCNTNTCHVASREGKEAVVCPLDKAAVIIGMSEYFKVEKVIRNHGMIFNRKLGKLVPIVPKRK